MTEPKHVVEATVKVYLNYSEAEGWSVAGSSVDGYALDGDMYLGCNETGDPHEETDACQEFFERVEEKVDLPDGAELAALLAPYVP